MKGPVRTGSGVRGGHLSGARRRAARGLVHPGYGITETDHRQSSDGIQSLRDSGTPGTVAIDLEFLAYDLRNFGLSCAANGGIASSGN